MPSLAALSTSPSPTVSEPFPEIREPRRVLLTGEERERQVVRGLFTAPALAGWEIDEADGVARAHFVLQMQAHDVVLVDGGLVRSDLGEGLAWLAEHSEAPLLLLADDAPSVLTAALRQGALGWLSPALALAHPAVLGSLLRQLARVCDLRRRAAALVDELGAAKRQIDRLAGMLWDVVPGLGPARWFPQRYMLERLDEELERTRRHGGSLSIVLGEAQPSAGNQGSPELDRVAAWVASQVGQSKRRCDVAGQYGLHGFMLVLPRAGAVEAEGACRRLRSVLEQRTVATGPFAPLHAYLAAATTSPELTTLPSLLRRAEEQLERAKVAAISPSAALRAAM
jgi:diguanylate cyclase (GGDEF)-like protein